MGSEMCIRDSINTSSSNQSCIGGICGYTGGVPFEISSCTFQGVIITEVGLSIGGIVGWISGYQRTTVADCQVKGDIIGYGSNDSQSSIGGIVGRVGTYGLFRIAAMKPLFSILPLAMACM